MLSLDSWFYEAEAADWRTPLGVTKKYANASIVSSDRVVFNIKGNDHRLVTAIDYKRRTIFMKAIERLWGSPQGTSKGDLLDVLITLVEAYERVHHSIDPPDPLDAIQFRLEQQGSDYRSLIGVIGHRTRVYEVVRGDRPLSLEMIRRLHKRFHIPAEILIRLSKHRRGKA